MRSKNLLSSLLFLFAGAIGLLCALLISTRVIRTVHSQEIDPPSATPVSAEAAPPPAAASLPAAPLPAASLPPAEITKAAPPAPTEVAPADAKAFLPEGASFLEPYVFDTREGRRNPFSPPIIADGTASDMMLPGTPLERYDLGELKLVGILWDVVSPKAMIIDPQGDVHILGKDDRVGRKRGYIAVIREGEVVVVETSNFNGENAYATRVLRIDK